MKNFDNEGFLVNDIERFLKHPIKGVWDAKIFKFDKIFFTALKKSLFFLMKKRFKSYFYFNYSRKYYFLCFGLYLKTQAMVVMKTTYFEKEFFFKMSFFTLFPI